jgi:hypothetical protein
MSNSPTLPPVAGPQRIPTPLPALASESDARVQAALAASARAETSLTGLFRAIQQLGDGVGGAREANESLTIELEGLRDLLGAASEQQQIFGRKIAELELVLDRTRKEHAQERVFLIDQQDLFLVKLLDEQELELKQRDSVVHALRARLAELEQRDPSIAEPPSVQGSRQPPATIAELDQPAVSVGSELDRAERAELERTAQKLAEDRERARETVLRLQMQRDEAQNAVLRIGQERDDALREIYRLKSELGGPRIPLSTRPPSGESRRDSSPARAQAAAPTLAQLELEARIGHESAQASAPESSTVASSPFANFANDSRNAQPISSILSPPRGNPDVSLIPSRLSPPPARPFPSPASLPPEELRRALTSSSSVQPSADNRAPLRQERDGSTRPLGGYSLGTGSIQPERLEAATQRLSKPPGSSKR